MKRLLLTICLLLVCSTAQAKNFCLDTNAVLCLEMDEGTGTSLNDTTANANTGTFKGAGEPAWNTTDVPFAVSGAALNSVDFDKVDDYISVAAHSSINDLANFSFVVWINADSVGENNVGRIFDKGSKITYLFDTVNHCTSVEVVTSGTGRQSVSNVGLTFGTWYHIAYTYNSGSAPKIYINGTESTYSSQVVGTGTDNSDSANALIIGNRISDTARTFEGKMTDIGLFSRVLTPGEILKIKNRGLNGRRIF